MVEVDDYRLAASVRHAQNRPREIRAFFREEKPLENLDYGGKLFALGRADYAHGGLDVGDVERPYGALLAARFGEYFL